MLGFSKVSRIEDFASALDFTRDSGNWWYLADVGLELNEGFFSSLSQRWVIRFSGILKGWGIGLYCISRWAWVKVNLVSCLSTVFVIDDLACACKMKGGLEGL